MNRRQWIATALGASASAAAWSADLKKQLKITGIETDLLRMPPREPTYDSIHRLSVDNGQVVLRILTDAGITGWASSNFGMIPGGPRVVQTILEHEVKPIITGMDPAYPRKIRAELWRLLEYHGVTGVVHFALSATDIALWDIMGKAAGLPVWKMLGAYRDRMPVYSMAGWYADNDSDYSVFKRSCDSAMEHGYKAVKIKVGRYSLDDDVKRIRMALDIVGKGKRVMVDANQVFNRNEALRRGRVYQEMGCFWYEEPLPPHDMDGYRELADKLDIRMATGENLYTKYQFAELINKRGADVVQPDNRRAGGVSEWIEIAALADGNGLELASHGGGSANMNMLVTMPNAIYMETGGAQKMVDGEVLAPTAPGMSTEVPADTIKKFKIG